MVGYSRRKSWENDNDLKNTHCVFLLVCEDKKTSPIYFNNYNARNNPLKIEIPDSGGKDPLTLVRYAKDLLNTDYDYLNLETGDVVWCVFDRDDFPISKIEKAHELAKENDIKICFSNPCFEVWFLLHFTDYTCTLGKCDNVINKLKEHIPKYSKNTNYYETHLKDHTIDAVKRAKSLSKYHKRYDACSNILEGYEDPSTQVYTIIEAISKYTGCLNKN
jgi:hypothetical protein